MNISPPSYIFFSNDQHAENDEHSDVTSLSGCVIEPWSNPDPVLAEMKLHMINQEAKLELLASKLSQCQVKNEILQAENAQLVNELVDAKTSRNTNQDPPEESAEASDTLETENMRLQVVTVIMRRSFQTYIKKNRSNLKDLQRKNTALQLWQKQQRSQPCSSCVLTKVSSSDSMTAKTYQEEELEQPKRIDRSQRAGSTLVTWITVKEGSRVPKGIVRRASTMSYTTQPQSV